MNTLLYVMLGLAAAGVLFMLARGVIAMASGRDVDGRTSNKFMSYRVILQLVAVLIVVAIILIGRN